MGIKDKIRVPKLAKDSLMVTVSNGLNYLVGAIWGVLLARWLGVDFFGIYIFWYSVSMIVFAIGEFGLTNYLTRELSKESGQRDFICNYFKLILFVNAILFFGLLVYVKFSENFFPYLIVGLTTTIIILSDRLSTIFSSWHYAHQNAFFISNLSVLRNILVLGIGFLFYLSDFNYFYILVIPAFFSFVRFLIVFRIILQREKISFADIILYKINSNKLKESFSATWIFGAIAIITTIHLNSDAPILRMLGFSEHDFGVIGAANRIKTVVALTGTSIFSVVFPRLSRDFSVSREKFTNTFLKVFKPVFVSSIVLCSFLIVFSDKIILLLFGQAYVDSVPFMVLFSYGSISTILILFGYTITSLNRQDFSLKMVVIIYTILPLLKLILIPEYGSIVIGWVGAIGPWTGFIINFAFIMKYLVPKINITFIFKMTVIILIGLVLPIFANYYNINEFVSFFIIFLLIIIFSGIFKVLSIKSLVTT
ncbi:MAG: oligosaccharide flippase family protein [Candidatus Cloacimonetes bacterium]|nr:oligosaccharide flippase family protein [Candidatus Cloacimonadota bacterium]